MFLCKENYYNLPVVLFIHLDCGRCVLQVAPLERSATTYIFYYLALICGPLMAADLSENAL